MKLPKIIMKKKVEKKLADTKRVKIMVIVQPLYLCEKSAKSKLA